VFNNDDPRIIAEVDTASASDSMPARKHQHNILSMHLSE